MRCVSTRTPAQKTLSHLANTQAGPSHPYVYVAITFSSTPQPEAIPRHLPRSCLAFNIFSPL